MDGEDLMIGKPVTGDELLDLSEREPFPWLLEKTNPSARYLAFRDLFDSDPRDPHTVSSQTAILDWPPVRRILDAMDPVDYWGRKAKPFYGGAIGTQATICLLAELGLPLLPEIEAACGNLLEYGLLEAGGFSYDGSPGNMMLCYTGTSIRALAYFGYSDDERVARALEYLINRVLTPGGLTCPLCETVECRWGISKALGGFGAIPVSKRTPDWLRATESLADAVLDHQFDFEGDDAGWLRFGFPLHYESDLLDLCDVLARLGYGPDPRFEILMDLVAAARTETGRWIKGFGTRALQVEKRGAPSKWITIRALRAARHVTRALTATARASLHSPPRD